MPSKTNGEGWLMVDNRASGGKLLEAATSTCSHCQRQVVRNPERERARAYCSRCDHYICDECAIIDRCRPFVQVVDEAMTATVRGLPFRPLGT